MVASRQGKTVRIYRNASHCPPISLASQRVLMLLWTCLSKLGVDVASWHQCTNMKICHVCNENLVEDEYHLLITCSTYKVICEKYDILNGHHTRISTKKGERICVCIIFTLSFSYRVVTPFLGRSHIQDDMLIWSHMSKLASSWMI